MTWIERLCCFRVKNLLFLKRTLLLGEVIFAVKRSETMSPLYSRALKLIEKIDLQIHTPRQSNALRVRKQYQTSVYSGWFVKMRAILASTSLPTPKRAIPRRKKDGIDFEPKKHALLQTTGSLLIHRDVNSCSCVITNLVHLLGIGLHPAHPTTLPSSSTSLPSMYVSMKEQSATLGTSSQ